MKEPGAQRYERPAEVLLRTVGDEMVLLNTGSEQYHSLNDVGRRCFELLEQGSTVDQTVSVICEEYEAGPSQVRADLEALLPQLIEAGLLRAAS